MKNKFIIATIITILVGSPTMAKTYSTNRVDSKQDWSIFVENNPSQCWIVSAPSKTKATRNGKTVDVKRSEIQLFALFEPAQKVYGQISFTGGYPFKQGSTVRVSVGASEHILSQTDGEWAWPKDIKKNEELIKSLKRGVKALVFGTSKKGTRTQDTFSLLGFSAALEEAQKRCGT
ncbi:MAG: hypothetical protein CMF45_05955 [Legionellales bacterium]|jgi:hypothetical protein|nr:hypothetical protein [Legionellales bacterium]MDG2096460.1 hypothetical protein [Paracoccaceae bacterium]|tara:strand:- start:987 stop:1514 length:528 start_codon:yes stop_codon:yes gene_type:complete